MGRALRTASLIGAPTDVGASDRGASMGPEALRVAGLGAALARQGLKVIDRGNLSGPPNPSLPPVEGYRHRTEVFEWNRSVHDAVYRDLALGNLPVLLGGDHSLGIGSISAGGTPLPRCWPAAARALARCSRGLQHERVVPEWQPAWDAAGVLVWIWAARAGGTRR